ncbi:acyltransferase family protein [Kordia sp.]|uniref:acyltransferase family protein n=1 Tax=Kordia sp. TaxID=1965332 RepID=UPI003D2A110B
MTTERRYDIDWLRVIAIGLLLIYHIAIIFQPWAMFIAFIRSNELLEGLWKPMTMLNVWRIPFLFYVSGMGLYFAMRKRNWKQLLKERSKRILLPFLFGIVAITPLHMYIFQEYYSMPLSYQAHMGHLWFLGNIFVYVIVLLPIFLYLKKQENSAFTKKLRTFMQNPLGPLAICVFFIAEVLIVKPQLFALYAQTWHGFFLGLLAFFFGFLFIYVGKTFWQTVLKWKWFYIGLASILFGIRYFQFATEAPSYLMAIESNCWIFGIFGLGYNYLNKPSKTLSYLSKAAYPVYIIHMFVLYGTAMLILPLKMNAWIQFVLITVITFIGCFIIYELILRRISILKPFFGLQWNYKTL